MQILYNFLPADSNQYRMIVMNIVENIKSPDLKSSLYNFWVSPPYTQNSYIRVQVYLGRKF